MRILLVEDDEVISKALEKLLVEQHYIVDVALDGLVGWELVEAFTYDLILLDVILPKLDGIKFCQRLRQNNYQMPVLMLTVQNSSTDKVMGLEAGADDYVVKPFELLELSARIRVLLRRGSLSKPAVLKWSNLHLDPGICEVTFNGRVLHFTPKEYRLLELFLRNHHHVFSRSAILDHLWSGEEPPSEGVVTVHIKDLRRKLKQAGAPTDLIETVYGLGYRLKQSTSPSPESLITSSQIQEDSIHQRIRAGLTATWERYGGLSHNRLATLRKAILNLLNNKLEDEQRQRAQWAAHKLAGALGIFGFAEAARLAGEIEEIFKAQEALDQSQALRLSDLLATLTKTLEQSVATSFVTSVKDNPAVASVTYPLPQQTNFKAVPGYAFPLLLVVDDDAELAKRIVSLADGWGVSMEFAPDLLAVRDVISTNASTNVAICSESFQDRYAQSQNPQESVPDVVLLNFSLADATEDSLTFLAGLANQIPPIPALFLTAQDTLVNRVKVARLNAHAFIAKSLLPEQLLEAIKRVRSQVQMTVAKVMMVDDDLQLLAVMRTLLEPLGLRLTTLNEPRQFWQTLEEFAPDLLILDLKMPHFSGIELCRVLRNTPQWVRLPILFLTAHMDTKTVNDVFAAGANDCVSKTIGELEVVSRILNRLERARLLQSVADVDRSLHSAVGHS